LVEPGDLATVTGWGATSEGGTVAAILQEVKVPLVSNAACGAAVESAPITGNMLCAGYLEGGKDSCQGDSGGPLVVPDENGGWKLAGLVSFGFGCAQPDEYGVYARVSRYTEWIQQYIGSATGPTLLRNANFDLGQNEGWSEDSLNGLPLIEDEGLPLTVTPRSAAYVAWLAREDNELSTIRQIVSLSERVTGLTFYYQIRSEETGCSEDLAYVEVNEEAILPGYLLCTGTVTDDWVLATLDLSTYAGRTVRLGFAASTNASLPSSFLMDDVAIAAAALPTLTVHKEGNGGGLVASDPAGITCGDDCSEGYDDGAQVTLSAQPDVDSTFAGWAGACIGDAPDCIVDMSEAKSVTATFTLTSYALTVNKVGNGTIISNPAGVTCGADCTESYPIGTVVTLTAQTAANSVFVGWRGACNGANTTCEVIIDAATNVMSTFALKTFALHVTKSGAGSGTITSEPAGVMCGADCTESYAIDTIVSLTAEADDESDFSGWGGKCAGAQTVCKVTINAISSVTAAFAPKATSIYLPMIAP
jgi:hypothetical protein